VKGNEISFALSAEMSHIDNPMIETGLSQSFYKIPESHPLGASNGTKPACKTVPYIPLKYRIMIDEDPLEDPPGCHIFSVVFENGSHRTGCRTSTALDAKVEEAFPGEPLD